MQQVLWETVFDKQFEEILESYGINKTDHEQVKALRKQLKITKASGCVLMIEVEEGWKEKLIQLLERGSKK